MIIKKVFEYEDMNFDFINDQLNGLVMELEKETPHQSYIDEKCVNIANHFEGVIRNFAKRMKDKGCQKDFLAVIEKDDKSELDKAKEWFIENMDEMQKQDVLKSYKEWMED